MTISQSGYRSLLTGIGDKTEITYVIGHRNPDSDSVGSAMAFAHLLRELGIRAGAAAALVFLTYVECGVEIPRDMARVMLMSILSDTRGMARNVSAVDRIAYDTLREIAQIPDPDALYRGMARALASYGDMSDKEIFMSDYKEYEAGGKRFGVAVANAFGEEEVRHLAECMGALMDGVRAERGVEMLFVIVNNKNSDESENMMYMLACGNGAAELLEELYQNSDGIRFFVFKENLSRKTNVVPAIISWLEQP